jgi:hypothetical protein
MTSRARYNAIAARTHDREVCAAGRQTGRNGLHSKQLVAPAACWRGTSAESLAIPHQRGMRSAGRCVPTPSNEWVKQSSLSGGRAANPKPTLASTSFRTQRTSSLAPGQHRQRRTTARRFAIPQEVPLPASRSPRIPNLSDSASGLPFQDEMQVQGTMLASDQRARLQA